MAFSEFHINEFAVTSDIPLPFDPCARSLCPIPEGNHITLRRGSLAQVPSLLRKLRRQLVYDVGDGFLIEPRGLTLHIDLKASVLTVDCAEEKLSAAAAWAFHAGLGAATVTRGGIPLHAAGLEIAGRMVALMAESGTGKSTLSWFLLSRGARFGSDDLIPTYLTNGGAMAYPSVSLYPKLQREAVDRHGLNPADLRVADYGTGEEEYYAPLEARQRVPGPRPLTAAFLLRPSDAETDGGLLQARRMRDLVAVRQVPEGEAAATFQENLHALWLIGKWVDEKRIAALCRALAAHVPLYELRYPKAYALLPELAEALRRITEAA